MSKESFRDKTAIITGGSRGLGLALAYQLASEGARISLWAREEQELRDAAKMIQTRYPRAVVHTAICDVTDRADLTRAFSQVVDRFGDVALLINNAGSILVGPFDSMEDRDFSALLDLHLFAAISTTRIVVKHFRDRKIAGRIVNISSLGGKLAVPHMLPYDASKFALAGFSQGVASELARENISVTTVYPTVMQTGSPIQAVFKGDHEREYAWFATTDMLPGISLPAQKAAKKIIRAARNRRSELIPSFMAKLRLAAGVLFPETMAKTMKWAASAMPRGQSHQYRTGAQSEGALERSSAGKFFGKTLKMKAAKIEAEFNQKRKEDAQFNLGLKNGK